MIRRDKRTVPYPRVERNVRDQPIWDIGPYGGYATAVAMTPLPTKWPSTWPDVDVLSSAEVADLLNGDEVVIS